MKHPKKTILVADDDQAILESIQLLLEINDYNVITTTGEDIVQLVATHKPDVVLLDLWMGPLSGKQLCRQLRTNADLEKLPILIVSASTEIQRSFKEAGATDYIEKPFDVDVLIKKIETVTS